MRHVAAERADLDRAGLAGVPLSVTELGRWTEPPGGRFYAPADLRARYLTESVERLATSGCDVDAVLVCAWTSTRARPGVGDDWYGLVGSDGAPTPSSRALAALLSRPAGAWPDPSRSRGRCAPPPAP